jgi:hypothetical protein
MLALAPILTEPTWRKRADTLKRKAPPKRGFSLKLDPGLNLSGMTSHMPRGHMSMSPMPPMPPPPPPPGIIGLSSFGSSATIASVVRMRAATDAAFCSA